MERNSLEGKEVGRVLGKLGALMASLSTDVTERVSMGDEGPGGDSAFTVSDYV